MLTIVANKIREHGIVWCVKRAIREFWHPTFPLIQKFGALTKVIYWPFAKLGKTADYLACTKNLATKDTVYVFYDFEVSPITYDYSWALALGELKRRELQLHNLHIVFVPGNEDGLRKEDQQYEKVINHAARKWRITNMLVPMLDLLPNATGFSYCLTREEAKHLQSNAQHCVPSLYSVTLPTMHNFATELKNGDDLRCFTASKQGLAYIDQWIKQFAQDRKVISVSIRQYAYMQDRNSNLAEWSKFLATLDRSIYAVVIIPDMDYAWNESSAAFENCHQFIPATWNLQLRAALYQRCYLNLGINSGPMSLCWLNKDCNYITFKMQSPDVSQTTDYFMSWLGFTIGESLPFVSPTQKWVWKNDDCEIIQQEFKLMCNQLQ